MLFAPAYVDDELANDFPTTLGMSDLGMELNAVEGLRVVGNCSKRRGAGVSNDMEIGRERR